ncbi:MBL fold metallo-hydrolase [Conexibacter woesei]|uniref:Beta-lactamase domain protein n=1 Tax=Conexibacter woesei (strain DSM 14684 / CCUG 47730 / CIP 108061 / JCM 11494 / NBRC 100937 / ID131577) TaxID=469383 RepID=D3FF88_CONWI|nr:MBL fold metallo-hydrolase [Conexibacter woesei]ADB53681.1 beta-lactamase domain protein [Conexibacter woesei DSM 14684]
MSHPRGTALGVKITVLGKSPAWQDAGGACSGYLIEEDGVCLLLDCGNGVFGKLREVHDYETVDAVVVTHLHADHCIDLIPYSYALSYSPRARSFPRSRPTLYVPPGGRDVFRQIAGAWQTPELVEQAFCLIEYDPVGRIELGPLTISFHEVPHFIRTHAVKVTGATGSFTFGADCCPNEALVEFARDSDLLMLEATLDQPETNGHRGHLTAAEAGEHGREAAARRLVLTHIAADADLARARSEAERTFGGPIEIAHEGAVYTV